MKLFVNQLKWQFVLLQKNNIITISFVVTLIYAAILFVLNDMEYLDKLLVSLVLMDPTTIGYFFIALAIYTERKHQILPAIFVTPVNLHHYIISKVLSLSVVGIICSLALAFSVKETSFNLGLYLTGTLGICVLSALLGIMVLPFASEFLNFAMISVPVVIVYVNLSLIDYLEGIDLGMFKYILPVQGALELIVSALENRTGFQSINIFGIVSLCIWIPIFYFFAYRFFSKKIVHQ
ncbi:MAG: hypothetical protein CMO01_06780 [Thalassobius sp.]|nr:hypothetical protein [Thalassovita sp.]